MYWGAHRQKMIFVQNNKKSMTTSGRMQEGDWERKINKSQINLEIVEGRNLPKTFYCPLSLLKTCYRFS
jgi:hypothetical protein